jgi:hypothetical protein
MLFDKVHKDIVRVAAGDDSRPSLTYINVVRADDIPSVAVPDGHNGVMLATDGFSLAVVPVQLEPGDLPGLLDPEHVTTAAKFSSKYIDGFDNGCRIGLGDDTVDLLDGSTRPRFKISGDGSLNYPDVGAVVPKMRPGVESAIIPLAYSSLNAFYLVNVVKALGLGFTKRAGEDCHIRISQAGNYAAPYIVETAAAKITTLLQAPFGLLMPVVNTAKSNYYHDRSEPGYNGELRNRVFGATDNTPPPPPDPEPVTIGYWGNEVPAGNGTLKVETAAEVPEARPVPVYGPMTDEEKAEPVPIPAGNGQYPEPTVDTPSMGEAEYWVMDGVCEATDGCTVEPDGVCPHGHPSWLIAMGVI